MYIYNVFICIFVVLRINHIFSNLVLFDILYHNPAL